MYKKVGLILLLAGAVALPVYAHLTGAFANFLAIVYDDSTISKLHQEMDETREEVEKLEPQVKQAETAFKEDQQVAVKQLQFYSEKGLDTWLALMQQGSDIVDIMGSQWVMEQKILTYAEQLNELYLQYEQLLSSQNTLKGHEQLLQAIEKNLQAREDYLAETAGLDLETIANYLDIDWTAEVEDSIIADFQKDADTIEENLLDWVSESLTGSFHLSEEWLNERSNARYYFRNDHIYVEYELEYAHVLILGQVLQNEEGTAAELTIEAGFYNGFFLPEELLVELPGFSIDYETLKTIEGIPNPFVIQWDGSLQLTTE